MHDVCGVACVGRKKCEIWFGVNIKLGLPFKTIQKLQNSTENRNEIMLNDTQSVIRSLMLDVGVRLTNKNAVQAQHSKFIDLFSDDVYVYIP